MTPDSVTNAEIDSGPLAGDVVDGVHVENGVPRASGWAGRRAAYAVVVPLIVLLLLWAWLFYAEGAFTGGPNGKTFEADFAMFYAGAHVLKSGGNPYDHTVLLQAEKRLMRQQGLRMVEKQRWAVVRVGNPPPFLWAIEPLTRLRFRGVAYAWLASAYAFALAGFVATLNFLGWRRRVLPSFIFLLMPPVLLNSFYGNPASLVFAALSIGLVLTRRFPLLAGALLSAAWIKPPVALPIVMLIVLFHSRDKFRVIAGFSVATVALLGLTILTTGVHSLSLWIQGLNSYSRDMAIQPDVASLAGLYVRWAPNALRFGLEATILAGALAVTAVTWWRLRKQPEVPLETVAWLWIVWMLATPYAHYFDEMLLAAPLLVLLGRDGKNITRRPAVVGLYLTFFSSVFGGNIYFQANWLSVFLLATLACLIRVDAHRDQAPRAAPLNVV